MEMTVKEIEKRIKSELWHIQSCDERIAVLKADKAATKKALAFWRGELKAAKKSEKAKEKPAKKYAMPWMEYWGGDAPYDVAGDLEETYEDENRKSAYLWTAGKRKIPSADLETRPEEHESHGYTCAYERWGRMVCTEAIEAGCADADAVEKYVMEHHGKGED